MALSYVKYQQYR